LEHAKEDTILVYALHISSRLSYILSVLFPGAVITDSKQQFINFTGVKINYSPGRMGDDSFWVVPYGLLDENDIKQQTIDCFEWEGVKAFFKIQSDLPFDLFSAAFYLLSRYEEYLPHELDEFGRYSHTNSIAYKEDFLKMPLVNLWLQSLKKIISQKFPHSPLTTHHSRFHFIPTYDIDIAYSYLHKPIWKNVLGFYRDLLQGKFEQVMERGNVYSGRKPDPFDVFEWMDELHTKYHLNPVYFFLTIVKRGKYDKNLSAGSTALRSLYKRLAEKYVTGIHPSWQSGTEEWLMDKEIETLKSIIQKPITLSRNHYLRFTIPHTYRRLLAVGITDDYSMAYGGVNGFRASYTLPYRWYDLENECITALTIHPFCFMEATSSFNQGFSAKQAGEELQYYHDTVKHVDGEFITLFHNHFLTEQPEWIEWRRMYADFLEKNFG
jgi:hypothetical protein